MRWKSYRIMELPIEQQADTVFDTLALVDSGFVASYDIINDYLTNDNSTLRFVGTTTTKSGDLVSIINDSVEIFSGVVVTVDNEQHTMSFNNLLSLLDTDILNPYRADRQGTGVVRPYEPVSEIVRILKNTFVGTKDSNGNPTVDKRRRVPLYIITSGNAGNEIWTNNDNSFNLQEWILGLFDSHKIVLQASIVFEDILAYVRIRVFVNTKSQDIIKMNVASMSIIHSETTPPKSTVCQLIAKPYAIKWSVKGKDSEDKDISIPMEEWYDMDKQELGRYYLTIDGDIVTDENNPRRFDLYKLVVEEYEQRIDSGERDPANSEEANDPSKPNTGKPIFIANNKITQQEVAQNKLSYNEFNHYVKITTRKDNRLIQGLEIGDRVVIVHKVFTVGGDEGTEDTDDEKEKYILSSLYTGRQESSDSETVTLIFGKIRTNYTEIKGR